MKTSNAGLALSDEAILKAVFSAWVELSVKGYDKAGKEVDYTEPDLLHQAMSMSELIIQTTPNGATIHIDGYGGYGNSDESVWISGKDTHTVVLSKTGYLPLTKTVTFTKDSPKSISLFFTLQRIK